MQIKNLVIHKQYHFSLVVSSGITLFRNATDINFVLGANCRIKNELENCMLCVVPITPKLGLVIIEKKWLEVKKPIQ
jgi:hypothetical protein